MSDDEQLARALQAQYDAEERARQQQEAASERLAQKLAAHSHSISDSEDEALSDKAAASPRYSISSVSDEEEGGSGAGGAGNLSRHHTSTGDEGENSASKGKCLSSGRSAGGSDFDAKQLAPLAATGKTCSGPGDKRPSAGSKSAAETSVGAESRRWPECQYGVRCYRRDPRHWAEFSHPGGTPAPRPPRAAAVAAPAAKRPRTEGSSSIRDRLRAAEPVSVFLTKVRSLPATWRERISLGLVELLDPSLGELRSSLQINFMVDLPWLLEAYAVYGQQEKPLTVLHGGEPLTSPSSNVKVQKVSMPFPFGTHHTKMMIFEYAEGLRVVVHTANLVDEDWRDKTQALWVSPLLPPLRDGEPGESRTGFRADLTAYLAAYKLPLLSPWLEKLARHDCSAVRAFFVSSVPGRHAGPARHRWGHARVRRLLQQYTARRGWPLLVQCSSIGSLGSDPDRWLLGELRESLTGGPSSARVSVIYPTEENVRCSLEGYEGGGCLPYHHTTHARQLWLNELLHQWRSDHRGRTGAMPHVKTYCQASTDGDRLGWLLLTSANLSKAAWGALEKQAAQLFIRSYEAGVLFLPEMLGCKELRVLSGDTSAADGVSLPFSLPLLPYGDDDRPWFADTAHPKPDPAGRVMVKK